MPEWQVGTLLFPLTTKVVSYKNSLLGLYTSPHLVAVRERIRINGAPLTENEFAKYFFEIWDRLIANDIVCCFTLARRGIYLKHHL